MPAYHSTKTMRDNVRTARDRAETAHKRAVDNLSPNAKALARVVARLNVILASEEAVTYVPVARQAPEAAAAEVATEVATEATPDADAIAQQAAAMAAEIDAAQATE